MNTEELYFFMDDTENGLATTEELNADLAEGQQRIEQEIREKFPELFE